MHLVIDESEAKGFSNNQERYPGELGVMAGFMLPHEFKEIVSEAIREIASKYQVDGKFHITDLASADQNQLRAEIFKFLKEVNACWVYEAVYVQGYYDHHEFSRDFLKSVKNSRRSKVKITNRDKKNRLHSDLFLGVFGKGIAFGVAQLGDELTINVITDNVDSALIQEFKEQAERFLNIGKPKSRIVKGYDPEQRTRLKGSITSEILDANNLLGDFSKINYSISCEISPLTLVADVLANSTSYYLKSKQFSNLGIDLNSDEAISDHPLSDLIVGKTSDFGGTYISDAIYKHPVKE